MGNIYFKEKIFNYKILPNWKPLSSDIKDIGKIINNNTWKIYYGKTVYNNKEINAVLKVLKQQELQLIDEECGQLKKCL